MKTLLRASTLAVAAFAAVTAFAQPKPALVQDIDQPARAKYQETVSVPGFCVGETSCEVLFSTVPAGKRLVVTWVNAIYSMAATSGDSDLVLGSQLGNTPQSTLLGFQPGPNAAATTVRTINTAALLYVDAGAFPSMLFRAESSTFNGSVTATLSGYYVSVP